MIHFASRLRFALLACCVVAQPALAARFCIRNQVIPLQCVYEDAQQCQREAARQNAECVVDPTQVRLTPQFGKYCVVTSGGASNCNFTDRTSCDQEARRQNGACAESPNNQPLQGPNPFSPTEGN